MKEFYKLFSDYFIFSKTESRGVIVLILLVLGVNFYTFYQWNNQPPLDISTISLDPSDFFVSDSVQQKAKSGFRKTEKHLKDFNPNTCSEKQFLDLGLNKFQISIIQNFLNKGGHFRSKEDFKKMYGISKEQYEELEPFILIPEIQKEYSHGKNFIKKESIIIELNSADSIGLLQLKGIGPVLAGRIIKYRKKLGGFISKDQLKEIFGIDEEKFQNLSDRILIDESLVQKISINTGSSTELGQHPYIGYKLGNVIYNYRKQHGNFTVPADLRNIKILSDSSFQKILPYIDLQIP